MGRLAGRLALWMVVFIAGLVGIIGALATLVRTPGTASGTSTDVLGDVVSLAAAVLGLGISSAAFRLLRGQPLFGPSEMLRRILPRRSWGIGLGVVLVIVGVLFLMGGDLLPVAATLVLAGIAYGFGSDAPKRGKLALLNALVLPTAFGVVIIAAFLTEGFGGFSFLELVEGLVIAWLGLLVTTGPGTLVGMGLHRLVLRQRTKRVTSEGVVLNQLRGGQPPSSAGPRVGAA